MPDIGEADWRGAFLGRFLNPSQIKFYEAVNSEIYVDKTELLCYVNSVIRTEQKYICVSRPRRFGKSVTANMLTAYYGKKNNAEQLFEGLKITKDSSFKKHLNQYNVIWLNMQDFLSAGRDIKGFIDGIRNSLIREIEKEIMQIGVIKERYDIGDLKDYLYDLYEYSYTPYVFVIDEWDCIFREYRESGEIQKAYLDFLRDLLKDEEYIALVYMTGILPIKKYGSHSALNMFDEFSMTNAGPLSEFVGFTDQEVDALSGQYGMDREEMKLYYDGYHLEKTGSVYCPRSVVNALRFHRFDYYWNQTETFEALRVYVDMNFEGLRDRVIIMLAGGRCQINPHNFQNDMITFGDRDDVLTLLVHLGYLAFDQEKSEVFIPNEEIRAEFVQVISRSKWTEVSDAILNSEKMLQAIWDRDADMVAKGIQKAHLETSYLQYNDENALSYTISLALYTARNYYTVIRELPSGRGAADMVFLPRKKYPDKPALLVELKWNRSAEGAIGQIGRKQYSEVLADYKENMLLVGVNYDKDTKEHSCVIEMLLLGGEK